MKTLSRGELEQMVAASRLEQTFGANAGGDPLVDQLLTVQTSIASGLPSFDPVAVGKVVAMVVTWVKQLLPIFLADPKYATVLATVNVVLDIIGKWFPAPTA